MLTRAMRVWDEDGIPDPDAVAFGEFILKVPLLLCVRARPILRCPSSTSYTGSAAHLTSPPPAAPPRQCGMARFPNNASLLIAAANVHIAARHDGQAARTQLQLANKAAPSLLERYFIFAVRGQATQAGPAAPRWCLRRPQRPRPAAAMVGREQHEVPPPATALAPATPADPGPVQEAQGRERGDGPHGLHRVPAVRGRGVGGCQAAADRSRARPAPKRARSALACLVRCC